MSEFPALPPRPRRALPTSQLLLTAQRPDAVAAIPAIDALVSRARPVVTRVIRREIVPQPVAGRDVDIVTQELLYEVVASLHECHARTTAEFDLWVERHVRQCLFEVTYVDACEYASLVHDAPEVPPGQHLFAPSHAVRRRRVLGKIACHLGEALRARTS